ncbi:lipase family protein [Nocardia callitridis]|uniref:Lipase n=1 Tax=Nocardia callitridis TaxID=648753 RepID=A0ABP9JU85_9NOCA
MGGFGRKWDVRGLVWVISGVAVLVSALLLYRPFGVSLVAGRVVVAVAMLVVAGSVGWRWWAARRSVEHGDSIDGERDTASVTTASDARPATSGAATASDEPSQGSPAARSGWAARGESTSVRRSSGVKLLTSSASSDPDRDRRSRRVLGIEAVFAVGAAMLGFAAIGASASVAMVWVGGFFVGVGLFELIAGARRDDPLAASAALAGWWVFIGVVVATFPFRTGLDFTAYTLVALVVTGISMVVRGVRLTLPLPRASALRWWRPVAAAVQLVVLIVGVGFYVNLVAQAANERTEQTRLDAFYEVPKDIPAGAPGTVIRSAPLTPSGVDGDGWRVLYWSQDRNGTPTVSSGLVFAPHGGTTNRPIMNYAHGTVSLGAECAPSRRGAVAETMPWLEDAIARGWVVAATDYAGAAGTDDDGEHYLVAADQGRDTLNAARAARNLPTGAGTDMLIYGVSQGGLISLAAAALAHDYTPELHLVADGAGAPASDLSGILADDPPSLLHGWAVTPFVINQFPKVYPQLDPNALLTPQAAARNREAAAATCTGTPAAALLPRLAVLTGMGDYFAIDPLSNPAWRSAFDENRAPDLPPGVPVYLSHGLADELIPAKFTASLTRRYCAAGIPVTTQWVPDTGHDLNTEKAVYPKMFQWFADHLTNTPTPNTCADPLPVEPADGVR